MRRYPKFLKRSPTFFGLDFVDLGLLVFALFIAMILSLLPVSALAIGGILIVARKFLQKRFDLTALLLSKDESQILATFTEDEEDYHGHI